MRQQNKKAALYCRVSTLYQIDKDSLPVQREELIGYAKHVLGITEYEVFTDAGYSGKDTDRPAYQDMMKRVRHGEFTHLMVWKIDRISRNLLDFAAMYDELKKLRVTFVSKNEQFDTSTAIGEAMLKIILIFAELERKMTSERVSSIMISRAMKGLWNGANVPLGFTWDEEKKFPVIDPEESQLVKLIFDMYLNQNCTTTVISHYLNDNGFVGKRGGRWSPTTVANILHNPFYKGTLRYNYMEAARGKKKPQSEWIIKDNNHPALISPEVFDQVEQKLFERRKYSNQRGTVRRLKHVHAFSHLIYCAVCGTRYSSTIDRPRADGFRPSMYYCENHANHWGCPETKRITDVGLGPFFFTYIQNMIHIQDHDGIKDAADLERQLLSGTPFVGISIENINDIWSMYQVTERIDYRINTFNASSVAAYKDTSAAKEELARIDRALKRLRELYLFSDDAMSKQDYLTEKAALTERRDKLIADTTAASPLPEEWDDSFLVTASQFIIARTLQADAPVDYRQLQLHTDPETLKRFVNAIVKKITVSDGLVRSITFVNGITHKFTHKKRSSLGCSFSLTYAVCCVFVSIII